MLHVLKHSSKEGEFYYLIKDREYIIGRKNTDIVISDDQSISRKHAIIKFENNALVLIDCGSKYGTAHNSSKLMPNKQVPLKDKDIIKFGVFQSTYKIETMKLVTTGSGLTNEQKVELKKKMGALGGIVLNNWEDSCSIVTSQEIMLTIKVLHALVDDKPIVTLKYWDQCLSSIKDRKPFPNAEDFKPPVAETLINRVNLVSNPSRKTLFQDKVFVFPTEKIKNRMSELITKTGGSSISWEKEPLTLSQVSKSKNNYLFIHCDEMKETPQSLKEITNYLTKLGERTIPIQEIAMSIVLCSCEKDCNPKFNRIHSVFVEQPPNSASEVFALAGETPSEIGSLEPTTSPKKELIIPESLDAELQFLAPSPLSVKVTPSLPVKVSPSLSKNVNEKELQFLAPSPSVSVKVTPSLPVKVSPSLSNNVIEKPHTSNRNPFACPIAKRPEKEPESTPSKRFKLDTSKPSTSQMASTPKRKADENENIAPPSKKSTLKENPFAVFRNRVPTRKSSGPNPFAAIEIEKQTRPSEDNSFKKVVVTTTKNDSRNISHEKSLNVSNVSRFNKSYCPSNMSSSNVSWKSKDRDKDCDKKIEIDPEFKEDFEKFKDVTVIEVIPVTTITAMVSKMLQEFDDSSTSTSGKRNFKKFKKSMPRRRQTTIISLVGQERSKQQEDDVIALSDEEVQIRMPSVKKTTKKRFNF